MRSTHITNNSEEILILDREKNAAPDHKMKSKMKKKTILQTDPFILLGTEKPDCVNAILSQTYSDIDDINTLTEVKASLTERIKECSNYQTAPLLAPFIHLFALSSLRGSNAVRKEQSLKSHCSVKIENKKLKTILSIDPTFVSDDDIRGRYTHKHSLFVTVKNEMDIFKHFKPEVLEIAKSIDPTLNSISTLTVFHEAAHYAALEMMENDCKPYKKDDLATRDEYLQILKDIKQVYQTWVPRDGQETIAILNISAIFDVTSYNEKNQKDELFVKVAELIGLLGYQNGLSVLNRFVPELVKFYEEKFNPACIEYLLQNKIDESISVDPSFSEELSQRMGPGY